MLHKLIINIVIYLLNLGSSACRKYASTGFLTLYLSRRILVRRQLQLNEELDLAGHPPRPILTDAHGVFVRLIRFFFHDYMHQYFAFKIRSSIFQFSLKVACMCMFVYELDVCVCVASLFSKDGSFYAASSSSPLLSSCRKVAA